MAGGLEQLEHSYMLSGFLIMAFVLLLVVVIAVAVIVGLALERRPASVWQEHLRDQREKLTNAPENDADPVSPHSTTLTDLMGDTSLMKNAYFDADRLPGVDRIERVTDRFEAMQEHRKAGKESSAE